MTVFERFTCRKVILYWVVIAAFLSGCATRSNLVSKKDEEPAAAIEAQWGVQLSAVRLTAAGHMIDFRYRVTDADKAETMMRRGSAAYLVDEASGIKLKVPVTKVGQLRGTGTKPKEGRVYSVLFDNMSGLINKGSLVTVVISDFKAEHLPVQ